MHHSPSNWVEIVERSSGCRSARRPDEESKCVENTKKSKMQPLPSVQRAEHRRNARLLTSLLAVFLPLPMFTETETLIEIVIGPLSFMIIVMALILLIARHRDRLDRDRQAELSESEARYRGLFESAFEGIATCQEGKLLDPDPRLAHMFGYSRSELTGMPVLNLVTEESRDLLVRHIESKSATPCEAYGLRKDSSSFRLEVLVTEQPYRGRATQAIAMRDITGRVQVEEALRQSVAEIENLQHITQTLLSLEDLFQVMNTVAKGIVTRLGYDIVLVSRYVEEEKAFTGLALYPIPMSRQLDRLLRLIGRPDLKESPAQYRVPYQRGENVLLDRVLDGEIVTTNSMADLFHPWVPHTAATAVQKLFEIEAYVDLPMQVKGKTVGTIVAGTRGGCITTAQQQALARVASQAAVALENARLYEQAQQEISDREQAENVLRRRNRELTSLYEAATVISSALSLNVVLKAVAEQMTHILDSNRCTLSLWHRERNVVETLTDYNAARSNKTESRGTIYTLSDYPATRRVLETCQPIVIQHNDPTADEAELALMETYPAYTLLMLPLVARDRVLGLVELLDDVESREYTPEQIRLAESLAAQAAIAIENAQLYEQAQREIAERTRAEALVKASLREKEVLLKEIHHRVKNNLQVVSSLLNLQSAHVEDPQATEIFQDSQNRIRSMALIHEKLYQSQDLARIGFAEYIHNLTTYLFRTYSASAHGIRLNIQADDAFLTIDTAVPCGLILNELISNALKHAFPDGQAGEIRVELHANGDHQVTLGVADTGVGLPKDLDLNTTTSLGLQLVHTLVDQLDGHIELNGTRGTEFKITFAVPDNQGASTYD